MLLHAWEGFVRPRTIPSDFIQGRADQFPADRGPRAEAVALINEDKAWRYSDPFEQGKWYRVRREISRGV